MEEQGNENATKLDTTIMGHSEVCEMALFVCSVNFMADLDERIVTHIDNATNEIS